MKSQMCKTYGFGMGMTSQDCVLLCEADGCTSHDAESVQKAGQDKR